MVAMWMKKSFQVCGVCLGGWTSSMGAGCSGSGVESGTGADAGGSGGMEGFSGTVVALATSLRGMRDG